MRTSTQSEETNLARSGATVEKLLAQKGGLIFSVHPKDSIEKTVDILREKRIGAVVVLSDNGDLAGILSERDIVRKLADSPSGLLDITVDMLMSKNVKVCSPKDTLISVLATMTEGRFRHMPVMSNQKLLGIVTIGDVVHFRIKELEHEAVQLKQMIVG
ncbi:MAG: CBS domain-containing protein [Pseudomonadota bacterium]